MDKLNTHRRWFWILIILLHALCFGKQLFIQTTLLQDSKEYLFAAENLIHEHTLYAWDLEEKYNPNWLTKRPVLYPSILAFVKLISFGNNHVFLFLILLFQNLISLFILRLVETIVLRLKNTFNYKMAALLVLFTPAQAIYANLIMSEVWLELILILISYCLLFETNARKKTVFLALLCIAAMALKPVMIFLSFCLPVYVLFTSKSRFKLFPISLIPLVYFIGVIMINGNRTGYSQYSSISTINLLQYNTYTLLINQYGLSQADSIIDGIQTKADNLSNYAAKQRLITSECRNIIGEHLVAYTYLHIRGTLLCLLDPGRFDLTQFLGLKHDSNLLYELNKKDNERNILATFLNPLGLLLLILFLVNMIKLFFGVRFVFSKTIHISIRLSLLFIPFYILLFTGPIGSSRFALPFFPVYLIIILMSIMERKKEIRQ